MSESVYSSDPRVRVNSDGSYTLPDPIDGDWQIRNNGHGWTAEGVDQALTDPGDRYNRRLQTFATADEAIAAIIGEPHNPQDVS